MGSGAGHFCMGKLEKSRGPASQGASRTPQSADLEKIKPLALLTLQLPRSCTPTSSSPSDLAVAASDGPQTQDVACLSLTKNVGHLAAALPPRPRCRRPMGTFYTSDLYSDLLLGRRPPACSSIAPPLPPPPRGPGCYSEASAPYLSVLSSGSADPTAVYRMAPLPPPISDPHVRCRRGNRGGRPCRRRGPNAGIVRPGHPTGGRPAIYATPREISRPNGRFDDPTPRPNAKTTTQRQDFTTQRPIF
jgi:hypothetical protein